MDDLTSIIKRILSAAPGQVAMTPGLVAVEFRLVDELAEVAYFQVWKGGVLYSWSETVTPRIDVTIRLSRVAFLDMLRASPPSGTAKCCEVEVLSPSGLSWMLPPTAADLTLTSSSEPIAGATLATRVSIPKSPVRLPVRSYAFINGVLSDGCDTARPQLSLELPLVGGPQYLMGALPFRDIAAMSRVDGRALALGCLTGLLAPFDSERWHNEAAVVGLGAAALLATGHLAHASLPGE